MTTPQQREEASDARFKPNIYYVYILLGDDGQFYIGQTNDLASRHAEHFIDSGAKATQGQRPRLVWFSHTYDHNSAKQMEQRLQAALSRSPLEIEQIVARFNDLLDLVRPQKTLRQLQEEERAYESEMRGVFHYSKALLYNLGPRPPTRCGYDGAATMEENTTLQMTGACYARCSGRRKC